MFRAISNSATERPTLLALVVLFSLVISSESHAASKELSVSTASGGGAVQVPLGTTAIQGIDAGSIQGIDAGSIQGIDAGSIQGIDAGSIQGIDAGSIQAIDAGSIQAIDAGSIQAIDAGSIQAIDAGSIQAIDAGSIQAIDAGSIQAIDAGSIQAIDAGSVQGIDAGSIKVIDVGSVLGIDAGSILGIDAGSVAYANVAFVNGQQVESDKEAAISAASDSGDSKLIGVIEAVDHASGTIQVLGQSVSAQAYTKSFGVGDYVAIDGAFSSELSLIATRIERMRGVYVPGVSLVRVTGLTTGFSPAIGQVSIGQVAVDFVGTPALATKLIEGFGILTSVDGVQPLPGGLVLASVVDDVSELMLVR